MKRIPSYEEALAIVKKTTAFYEKKEEVDGVPISLFSYLIATPEDFIGLGAEELRGICYNPRTNQRFLMLHKFFNINQTKGYLVEDVINKKIVRVQDKADGSMIRFIEVNGKILAKTKMGFKNDQSIMAQDLYNKNPNLKKFVDLTIEKGLAAIFELVSPFNKIVLDYDKTDLLLLQLRKEDSGEYLNIYDNELVREYSIKTVESEAPRDLKYYLDLAKTIENKEGWILQMEDGQMVKVKTEWYFRLHGLVTESLVRENLIVGLVLNEQIDDAISLLPDNDEKKKYAQSIEKAISEYLSKKSLYVKKIVDSFEGDITNKQDIKKFVLDNNEDELFGIIMYSLKKNSLEEIHKSIKDLMAKECRALDKARLFLKTKLNIAVPNLKTLDID